MKKLIIIFAVLAGYARAQTTPTIDPSSCMNQQTLYTRSTDPSDQSTYTFSYTNLNPNTFSDTHFDWVNTQYLSVYANTNPLGIVTAPVNFISPFYCNGYLNNNGSCTDNNTALYNSIKLDPSNQYANTAAKLKAMDILPEDGWELIKYDFGRAPDATMPGDPGSNCPNPMIWLYNRYTGKMKLFVAISNVNLNTAANPSAAIIKITTNPAGQYDLFANARPFTHILSAFNHVDDINTAANCDLINLNAAGSGLQYYWLYSEFTTSYDPCVCRQANMNITKLRYDIILTQVSSVNEVLEGTATPIYSTSTSMSANVKSADSYKIDDNAGSATGSQLIAGGQAVIKGYKDWKEYADQIKGFFDAETNSGTTPPTNPLIINLNNQIAIKQGQGGASASITTSVTADYLHGTNNTGTNPNPKPTAEAIQTLAGLAPLVEGLASAAPYVGAFIALTNFLSDAGSSDAQAQPAPTPPTAYALNAKITGSITLNTTLGSGEVFMPGEYLNRDMSITGQKNADVPFPIYNNPLGVFNIVDVPNFEYKTIPMTNNGVDTNDPNQVYTFYSWNSFAGIDNVFEGAYDYRLSGPIKYALNPASNLSVKSIDAAYVLEYDGTDALQPIHNANVTFFPNGFSTAASNSRTIKQIPYYPYDQYMYTDFNPQSTVYPINTGNDITTIIRQLKTSGFDIEYSSPSYTDAFGANAVDEKFRVRTQYVPIQSLPSIDFILIGKNTIRPKIYLKLLCKFSKNNNPNAEPVTFILTYDLSTKLANAQSTGSGGSGSYNYYYAKDAGQPNPLSPKPGDYGRISRLNILGAYYTPNYGNASPLNISSPINGGLSTGTINFATGLILPPTSTGYETYSAVTDLNMGNDVAVLISNTPQNVSVRAGNNMTIGKGFLTSTTGTGNQVSYYAGNNITINESYVLGLPGVYNLTMYAGNKIALNNNSNYYNLYASASKSSIYNASLYAKNEIDVSVGSSTTAVEIEGESVLSTLKAIPNAWALLHNDDGSIPVTNLQASNSDLVTLCSNSPIGNRMAHLSDTSANTASTKQPAMQTLPDYKISIYPNPTNGNLNVNLFTPEVSNLLVTIEDLTGKQLLQQSLNAGKGYSQNQLNLEGLVNGAYILKISDLKNGNIIKTQKVILNK